MKLPLDINEDTIALEDFRKALTYNREKPVRPPTTLTEFIHNVRIRRILSNIQHQIYRVDQKANPSHDIIDGFLSQLFEWRKNALLEQDLMDDAKSNQTYRNNDPSTHTIRSASFSVSCQSQFC